MSDVTVAQSETPAYSENYRSFTISLYLEGDQWIAKATGRVQWVTSARRSWLSALFELYGLVDRYERAQLFCRLNRLQRPAVGAVEFTLSHEAVRS